MRGDNHLLAVTSTKDEISGEIKPLFSLPIQICQACDEVKVSWDIAAPSGAPRKQQYVDTGTDEVVADEDCKRGIRLSDDDFRAVDPDDVKAIEQAVKNEMMIVLGKIPYTEIPWDRQVGIYFVQSPPKGGGAKSYRLVKEALRAVKKGPDKRPAYAFVTKRTVRSKQQLGVIYCDEQRDCLMFSALRFANAMREPDEQVLAPNLATVDEKQLQVARQVIDTVVPAGHIALATEYDEAVQKKLDLIEQAVAGEALDLPTPVAETSKSEDLMSALEASLEAATKS